MSDSMIDSNNKGGKYDLNEYKYAKQVLEDFPAIIHIIEKLIPALEDKSHYTGIYHLLQAAYDSHMTLAMQYDYYKKIYDQKGRKYE